MDEKIIAEKNNQSVLTQVSTIILLAIFISLPPYNMYIIIVFSLIIIVVLVFLLIHLLTPRYLITMNEDKLNIHRINKVIVITPYAISTVEAKHKRSRGLKYRHGTLTIYLKTGEKYEIKNVSNIVDVKAELLQIIRTK